MDRTAVHERLHDAGLPRPKVEALTNLLWNVHIAGHLHEVDFARLSDAGFRHLDVCIIRELLDAALNRLRDAPAAPPERRDVDSDPVASILGTFEDDDEIEPRT